MQDATAQIVKKEVELGDYFKKNIEDKDFSMSFQISSLGGKELFSYHSKDRLIPASILKLLTTVAALRKLGGSYRFPTEIFVDSLPKQIGNEGEISVDFTEPPKEGGNLYLRGYGDPSM